MERFLGGYEDADEEHSLSAIGVLVMSCLCKFFNVILASIHLVSQMLCQNIVQSCVRAGKCLETSVACATLANSMVSRVLVLFLRQNNYFPSSRYKPAVVCTLLSLTIAIRAIIYQCFFLDAPRKYR